MPRVSQEELAILAIVTEAGTHGLVDQAPTPDQWRDILYTTLDLADAWERLAALEAWTATATETMLDSAAALATAGAHEQAARLLACVNERPDRGVEA